MNRLILAVACSALAVAAFAQPRASAPAGARVYFISPKNGAHVQNPVVVKFGMKGMTIAPAGTQADKSGHHHLLVDTDLSSST